MNSIDEHLEEAYEDVNGDPFGHVDNSDGEFDWQPEDDELSDADILREVGMDEAADDLDEHLGGNF